MRSNNADSVKGTSNQFNHVMLSATECRVSPLNHQLMLHLFSTADSSVLHTEHMGTDIKAAPSVSASEIHTDSSHSMDNRPGFPRRITREEYLQTKPKRLDATAVGGTLAGMDLSSSVCGKFTEKEVMHGLNDRLAGFIDKVHQLEYQNHLLESEIEAIRGKAKSASCYEEEYGPELSRLRQLVLDITHQRRQIETEHQNLEEDLSNLRKQHEQEARSRSDVESNIMVLKKDISDAYQAKLQLEKKAQVLVDEIHFLKRTHEAEVSEMFEQIQTAQVTVNAHEFGSPGITAALRDIRAQLEGHAATDVQQAGETFRSQFARLTEAAEAKREALKASQQEIQEYRRRLQAKNIELDCAKGTREALEKQLHDVEDRHKEEMIRYQNTIKELENDLINCKFDMSGYLREYQDLLNVKMALDVEILSYRKLLCGEEARLSTVSDTHISLPYIYHQSPIYTLPCLSQPGGPDRRLEPQYKFVEEIITETTRETVMSEFEETGSEETEVGKDEWGCAKRDRGGSEEEKDNKDSREAEGEQMSDSQQDQVESGGNAVNETDDKDEKSDEVDDGDKGQKGKAETEKTEAVNQGDSGKDKNTQSKVLLSESLDKKEDKQDEQVGETTKEEKEAVVTKVTVQKDDLTSQVPAEDEHPKISANDKKGDAEEERFISDQMKESVHETRESNEIQELSSTVQVQDEVRTSDTVEKPTDFKAETKSTLFVDTEDAQVTSTTTKSEEKEHSHTEPKEKSKSEAVKGEDKVATPIEGRNKNQDKAPALNANEKSLPEVKGQMPNSGDKTEMAKTVLPKEKTTDTAEVNQVPNGAPQNSQTDKSDMIEGSQKINDPQDKALYVEGYKSEE